MTTPNDHRPTTSDHRALFFDMDGTILDWQSNMEASWRASCDEHCDGSYDVSGLHDAIRTRRTWFWGDSERARTGRMDLDASSRAIVRAAFEDLGLADVELAHRISDDYRARREQALAPYPGALDALAQFRARGHRMALITNGNAISQRRSVERFGLTQYFDCVIIEGEFGCGKPDERVFRHALASCGARPEEAWMVGDSLEADIATPLRLGMQAIWIDATGELPEHDHIRPHRRIRSITELL